MFSLRMDLHDRGRSALMQSLLQRRVGLHATDMVVTGLNEMHGTGNFSRKSQRILLLVCEPWAFD